MAGYGDGFSARDRIFDEATDVHESRSSFAAVLFAVSLFLLLFALSVKQSTEPAGATPVLQSGIAVVTDIDRLLVEDLDPLRQLAANGDAPAYEIPGYPLDVLVTRDELLRLNNAQLRGLILVRSSALVYQDGLKAFDRTGDQSISRFSSQGMLNVAVGQVSQETNDRASLATFVLAATTALASLFVVFSYAGWARMRALGFAGAAGAIPGLLVFVFAWWIAGRIGGSDPFVADLRTITRAMLTVPLRNYAVVAGAGVLVGLAGPLFSLVDRRFGQNEPVDDPDAHGYEREYEPDLS
jgi:hypothetical protein